MAEAILSASGIYKITHKDSGKVYVGSAVNLKARWCGHRTALAKNNHRNHKLQHAFNKYGLDAFVFDVIEFVPDKSSLLAHEQRWINSLDAVSSGYNITPTAGSRLGTRWSEEKKARHSARLKGRVISAEQRIKLSVAAKGKKRTPEHQAKINATRTGMKMPNITLALLGKRKSPESIEKQRKSLTGRKQPSDEIARRSASMMGQKRSEEARANMRKAQNGHSVSEATREKLRLANIGKKHSQETIEKRKIAYQIAIAKRRLSNDSL